MTSIDKRLCRWLFRIILKELDKPSIFDVLLKRGDDK